MPIHIITGVSGWNISSLLELLGLLVPVFGFSTSSVYGGGRSFSGRSRTEEKTGDSYQQSPNEDVSDSRDTEWKSREECARLELELVELERRAHTVEKQHQDTLGELGGLYQKIREIKARVAVLKGGT